MMRTVKAGSRGQAIVEYVVALGMLLAASAVMVLLLYSFREYGGRVLDLIASEFP